MRMEKFKKVCVMLCLTFKGLAHEEINQVVHFEKYEWQMIKAFFSNFFFTFKGFWKVSDDTFKKVVEQRYMKDKSYNKQVHIDIANALDKNSKNSIRKLEEKTNHLYKAEEWGNLKHT